VFHLSINTKIFCFGVLNTKHENARGSYKQNLFKTPESLVWQGLWSLQRIFTQEAVHNCRKIKVIALAYVF